MIKLRNGYEIVSDGKSYTLFKYVIQERKNGSLADAKKQISFHSTLSSALQGYLNCMMADLVSNIDLKLKEVKQAISNLYEELKAYE